MPTSLILFVMVLVVFLLITIPNPIANGFWKKLFGYRLFECRHDWRVWDAVKGSEYCSICGEWRDFSSE